METEPILMQHMHGDFLYESDILCIYIKATPHRDCASDFEHNFSSD